MSKLDLFYRENFKPLSKSVSRVFNNRLDIGEDVVQEAFVRCLTYIHTYDENKSFKTWFNSILSNCIRDKQKEERSRGISYDIEDTISLSDLMLILDDAIDLEKYIKRYTGIQYEVLRLFYFLNLNSKEISDLVEGTTHSSVRTFLHRFRESFKKHTDEGFN